MDKLTKFVKEQSLQRSERSARTEEQAMDFFCTFFISHGRKMHFLPTFRLERSQNQEWPNF